MFSGSEEARCPNENGRPLRGGRLLSLRVEASGHPDCRIGQARHAVEIGLEDGFHELLHGLVPSGERVEGADQTMIAFSVVAVIAIEANAAKRVVAKLRMF